MSEETTRAREIDEAVKAADARKRADAEAGEKLDTVLTNLDSFAKGLDSLCKRMDALEAEKKKADDDGDEETAKSYPPVGMNPLNRGEDPDAPRPLGADSRSRSDSIRAADEEEISHFKATNGATYKVAADSVLAHIQSDADRASSAWGKDAPHPWQGENITAYRRRSATEHQQHSPAWKNVDLRTLSGQALRNATAQIFADSIAASSAPESYGEGLREVRHRDPDTGHLVKEYFGEPRAWMQAFSGGPPRLAKFRLDRTKSD
jgi:colicin import membrane protein